MAEVSGGMKQSLSGVLAGFQGLGSDESRERPVDRLAALGAIQIARSKDAERHAALCSLGVELIAFKFGNRRSSKQDAEDRLALVLSWKKPDGRNNWGLKLSPKEISKVAQQAVLEFAIDMCPVCKGAKEIPDRGWRQDGRQPMKCCPPNPTGCGGTGKRRYLDSERAQVMGKAFADAMYEAHGVIAWAESMAVRRAKEMLERW